MDFVAIVGRLTGGRYIHDRGRLEHDEKMDLVTIVGRLTDGHCIYDRDACNMTIR